MPSLWPREADRPDRDATLVAVSLAHGPEPEATFPQLHGSGWPGEDLVAQLREVLRAGHLANAREPITGVADDGAFLDSLLWGSAGQPVVVDANWLRNDLLRFCLRQEQTIMLTAANSGLLRLYCARHVLDEVDEHHATWALAKGLPAADVLHSWRQNYLPLLRRVDPPIGLLTVHEQARIDVLHVRDPDDVPSATLALLLQAPLVSGDKRPTQAVYGSGAAVRRQADLLELLRVAGDMVQLGRVGRVATIVPFVGGSALLQSAVKVAKAAPVVALLAAAVGVVLARRVPTQNWRRVGGAAGRGVELTARLIAVHQAFQEHVKAAAPELPQWNELASHPAEPVLTRALMWTLAHAPRSQMTVAELVAALPPLTDGHGERPTRHVLRSHRSDVFQDLPRGHWQLGRSALPIGACRESG